MNREIKIDFRGTRIEKLVLVHRFFSSAIGRIISLIFWAFGLAALGIWISWLVDPNYLEISFGLDQIFLAFFLIFLALRGFFHYFVKNPAIITPADFKVLIEKGGEANIVNSFSVSLAQTLMKIGKNLSAAGLAEILYQLILAPKSNFIFARLGIDKKEILDRLGKEKPVSAAGVSNIAERALEIAIFEQHRKIETGDMLVALSEAEPLFSGYLSEQDLTPEDLANIVYWQSEIKNRLEKERAFLDPENLHLTGGIGKDWAFGFTPDLNKYSIDITEEVERQGLGLELVGHDKDIGLLEDALNRVTGANAILVGEPGIGKKTTVFGFAKNIDEGKTLPNLAHRRMVELNIDQLISGLSGPGEFTERISRVFAQAANAGNVIIFIDGIEKILSSGEAGQIDATSVLIPYLSYPEINFIGTTDIADYNNLIAPNSTLMQKFEKIEIAEPTDDEMIRILEDLAPRIEYHYQALITYAAIKEVVKLAKKYILDQPNPEKSISLLEGAANTLAKSKNRLVDAEVIDSYITSKTNIPVKEAAGKERDVLINLEEELHKRVINQNSAIKEIAGALRRSRAGVSESKKPIGSFLFLGPTGVGKTETAKALSAVYFGSEEAMIRFDMSEYQNKSDIYRLIGSPTGAGEKIEGELTSRVRNKPFSLILFDEVEKASPDILNLFLQILDEGFITSSAGRKVYFKNAIIIATSNAGANLIRQLVEKNTPYEQAQKQVVDYVQNQGIFKPEFLNRFSSVVYYSPLTREQIKEVAKIMIRNLARDIYQTKGIALKIEMKALEKLAELGYDPEMGARPMERVIAQQVENFLAEKILRGEAPKGQEVIFRLADIK